MKMLTRSAKTLSLLATLTLATLTFASGCVIDSGLTDDLESTDALESTDGFDDVGETEQAISATTCVSTSSRVYKGIVTSCPAGWQKIGAVCYGACQSGFTPWTNELGSFCRRNGTEYLLKNTTARPWQSMICASGLEYINGSCYAACPSGMVSNGILGCTCGGGA